MKNTSFYGRLNIRRTGITRKKISTFDEFATKFYNCDGGEVQRKIHNLRNQVFTYTYWIKLNTINNILTNKGRGKWKLLPGIEEITKGTGTHGNTFQFPCVCVCLSLLWSLQFLVRVFTFLSLYLWFSYFGTFPSTWSK